MSIPCFSAPLEISILDIDGRPVEDVVVYVTASSLPNETDPPEDLVTEISQENPFTLCLSGQGESACAVYKQR